MTREGGLNEAIAIYRAADSRNLEVGRSGDLPRPSALSLRSGSKGSITFHCPSFNSSRRTMVSPQQYEPVCFPPARDCHVPQCRNWRWLRCKRVQCFAKRAIRGWKGALRERSFGERSSTRGNTRAFFQAFCQTHDFFPIAVPDDLPFCSTVNKDGAPGNLSVDNALRPDARSLSDTRTGQQQRMSANKRSNGEIHVARYRFYMLPWHYGAAERICGIIIRPRVDVHSTGERRAIRKSDHATYTRDQTKRRYVDERAYLKSPFQYAEIINPDAVTNRSRNCIE